MKPVSFLLIATRRGLARFDDLRFEELLSRASGRVQERARVRGPVLGFAVARAGWIWIAAAIGWLMITLLRSRERRRPEAGTSFPRRGEARLGMTAGRLRRCLAGGPRLLALALVLGTSNGWSSSATGDYFADAWTPEDGLPDSSVTSIVQTPDGYLWVGTQNGLARFDGESFVLFEPANTPSLTHAKVRKLFVDRAGTLWINTRDGSLTALRRGTFVLERRNSRPSEADLTLASSSSSQVIFLKNRGGLLRKTLTTPAGQNWEELPAPNRGWGASCCEDSEGTLWYRDREGQVSRLAGDRLEPLPPSAGLVGQKVNCLTTDPKGRVFVGTDKGIFRWSGAQFQNLTPTNASSPVNVTFLFITSHEHIWAVADRCLREAVDSQWMPEAKVLRGVFTNDLSRIGAHEGRHGGIWFYNYGRGLLHLSADGSIQELTPKDGFPTEPVNCFFEDREGDVWAGLKAGGLLRVRERQFRAIDLGERIWPRAVKSVCEDAQSLTWIGTLGGGLACWRDGTITNVPLPDQEQSIFCVCPDPKGRLWLAGGEQGILYVREDGRFRRVSPEVRGVRSILAGHNGRIWVGTKAGLYFADPPADFRHYPGVPSHYLRALAEDAAGALWVGSGNGDLYRLEGDAVTTFHAQDSEASAPIWSLLADKAGTLWAGTFRGGLLKFQNGQFTRFNKNDGLPDNVICQILDDDQGNLWLGSRRGVFRVSKASLNAYKQGNGELLPGDTFGLSDGLPSLECSGDYQPTSWHGHDGRLWFATLKGLVFTQPRMLRPNPDSPLLVIEDCLLDGKTFRDSRWQRETGGAPVGPSANLRPADALVIPPGSRRIEFHFRGLSLANPGQVRYRYRLEGLESDWVDAGTTRLAQYNSLPPGDYRFHVSACNSDGVWNEAGAVVSVKILPHLYETWWFRVLTGVAVLAALAGTVRFSVVRQFNAKMEQLKRQQAVERERVRIAKDIHDDLGSSLTRITMLSQSVLGETQLPKTATTNVERIYGTACELTRSMDEIVWAVDPHHDTLVSLENYLSRFAHDFLSLAGIRCRFDLPSQFPAVPVTAEVRHNLLLAFKEALHNAVRHAGATEVQIELKWERQTLVLSLADNGHGFVVSTAPGAPPVEPNRIAGGHGLANMKRRMAEIGGACDIQSEPGRGTTLKFILPLHTPCLTAPRSGRLMS